jgi:hypothetical protein
VHTVDAARLERANLGPIDRAGHDQAPAPELGRRLLEQIAAGAIWAGPTSWARDTTIRDTAGNYLDPAQRATANAVLDMLTDWLGSNAVAYTGDTIHPGGLCLVQLRGPGYALLADLWEIPEEDLR